MDGQTPIEEWEELFSTEALTRFAPVRGADGFPPMLEVYYVDTTTGASKASMFYMAELDFNDRAVRYGFMEAVGKEWTRLGWKVAGLILAAEAWGRTATPEEVKEYGRGKPFKPVSTYSDKKEIITVTGLAIDGRISMANADLLRDHRQKILGLGTWDIEHQGPETKSRAILLETAFKAHLEAWVIRNSNLN